MKIDALVFERAPWPVGAIQFERNRGRRFGKVTLVLVALAFVLAPISSHAACKPKHACATRPTDLGTITGNPLDLTRSGAQAISRDGKVVVGWSELPSPTYMFHAMRWTAGTGMIDLDPLGERNSFATRVSEDGNVIVGDSIAGAFRWTSTSGMVFLGTIGGDSSSPNSEAWGVSNDGSVVVGASALETPNSQHAFRWTSVGGMIDLGTLGGRWSRAFDVSGNRAVVVGEANTTNGQFHAFRWTKATGMVDLDTLAEGQSQAFATNVDGSVIVGFHYDFNSPGDVRGPFPFRWTSIDGMVNLARLIHRR